MNKVENTMNYKYIFDQFEHNVPVIFSALENQYPCELYVDDVENASVGVLFTSFGFHYVAGDTELEGLIDILDTLIFKEYIHGNDEKEAIFMGANDEWHILLGELFDRYNGIRDSRFNYKLNKDKFESKRLEMRSIDGVDARIEYEKENGSKIDYPVCRIYESGLPVSFCKGFMMGNGHAEIDVFTEEGCRGKGYAKVAATKLISKLLDDGIEPDWCTWPYRKESQSLALSLGYELKSEVDAFIWVEEECGKII